MGRCRNLRCNTIRCNARFVYDASLAAQRTAAPDRSSSAPLRYKKSGIVYQATQFGWRIIRPDVICPVNSFAS